MPCLNSATKQILPEHHVLAETDMPAVVLHWLVQPKQTMAATSGKVPVPVPLVIIT